MGEIMLPRLGAHVSIWGHGHSCDSDGPHEGPCVCECGISQPFDSAVSHNLLMLSRSLPTVPFTVGWLYRGGHDAPG